MSRSALLFCSLLLGLGTLALPVRSWAGAFAACQPEATAASRVAAAKLIVQGRALKGTTGPRGEVRSRFAVVRVLKGTMPDKTFVLADCAHWKCQGLLAEPGQEYILFLAPPYEPRAPYSLRDPGCRGGFTYASLRYDLADARVQSVLAAVELADSAPGAPDKPSFPAYDATPCATDADCAYSYHYAMSDGRCCTGTCSPKAVSAAALTRIEGYCTKAGYDSDNCPLKKCAAPPPLRCKNHSCQLGP